MLHFRKWQQMHYTLWASASGTTCAWLDGYKNHLVQVSDADRMLRLIGHELDGLACHLFVNTWAHGLTDHLRTSVLGFRNWVQTVVLCRLFSTHCLLLVTLLSVN